MVRTAKRLGWKLPKLNKLKHAKHAKEFTIPKGENKAGFNTNGRVSI